MKIVLKVKIENLFYVKLKKVLRVEYIKKSSKKIKNKSLKVLKIFLFINLIDLMNL